MKAAVYRQFGPPEVVRVEELATPLPGSNEVLVKVHASTLSAADLRARGRDIPRGLGMLATPALGVVRPRGRRRHSQPRTMGCGDAVTLLFGGLTAGVFLSRARINRGDTVLVNGASAA